MTGQDDVDMRADSTDRQIGMTTQQQYLFCQIAGCQRGRSPSKLAITKICTSRYIILMYKPYTDCQRLLSYDRMALYKFDYYDYYLKFQKY